MTRFPVILIAFCLIGGLIGYVFAQWVKWPLTFLCAIGLMAFTINTTLRAFSPKD